MMIKHGLISLLLLLIVATGSGNAGADILPSFTAQASQGGNTADSKSVEYNRLMKWHGNINTYIETIEKFMSAYGRAVQAKSAGVAGSLLPAQKYIETMNNCQSKLCSMTPDSQFSNGHRYLISSFDNFKNSLIFPTGSSQQQDFLSKAQSDYSRAQVEFNNYLDEYNRALEKYSQP
jgi:hypothetical protein